MVPSIVVKKYRPNVAVSKDKATSWRKDKSFLHFVIQLSKENISSAGILLHLAFERSGVNMRCKGVGKTT
jgi:hypothetical protein